MNILARLSGGALSAVLVIGLAGCNDSSPAADPDPGESSASSPTESPSGSTAPPEPTVAPADGELIENDYFSVRAPKGFVYKSLGILTSTIYRASSDDGVYFSVLPYYPTETSLDELADNVLSTSGYEITPKRIEDSVIDGRPVWHATGPIDDRDVADLYGLWINGASVYVTFETLSTGKERTKLIESMLATWTWK